MKLTTEQAKTILEVEPFAIVRLIIDGEGYPDVNFDPILVATNVWWDTKELNKFVEHEVDDLGMLGVLRSCQATYLWHIKSGSGGYPDYEEYWELVEIELLDWESFVIAREGEL